MTQEVDWKSVATGLRMNPHQSQDLNIIEAVWDYLDRERNKSQPTSKEELQDVLQEACRRIPEDYLKLKESLSKWVQGGIKEQRWSLANSLLALYQFFIPAIESCPWLEAFLAAIR